LIRRIVDREQFRIECERCGRFEIDAALLDNLRRLFEDDDRTAIERLSRLAEYVRQAAEIPSLSTENWVTLGSTS
jgi:hypothetical protein